MLLRGLRYEPRRRQSLQTTRRGAPVYDGTPDTCIKCKLIVLGKLRAVLNAESSDKAYKHAELASQLHDGLQDEALSVVRNIGYTDISDIGGIEKLLKALEEDIHTD